MDSWPKETWRSAPLTDSGELSVDATIPAHHPPLSAWMIGSAQLASRAWPPLEAWLRRALPGGDARVAALKAWGRAVWWRSAPQVPWRAPPAPYNPAL